GGGIVAAAAIARSAEFRLHRRHAIRLPHLHVRGPVRSHHAVASHSRLVQTRTRAKEGIRLVREFGAHDRSRGTRPSVAPSGRGRAAVGGERSQMTFARITELMGRLLPSSKLPCSSRTFQPEFAM